MTAAKFPPPDSCDWVAIHRLVTGKPVGRRPTWAERVQATRILLARGKTQTEISQALHANGRDAKRLVTEARQTGEYVAYDLEEVA